MFGDDHWHINTRVEEEEEEDAHERVGNTDGVIDGERVGEIVDDTLGPSEGL